MRIWNRLLVVAIAAAVAVVPSTAAVAGEKGKGKAKKPSVSKQHGKAKGKGRGDARKVAARAKFTVPGRVTATDTGAASLRIARKERGVTVVREFVLAPNAAVKRDGVRVSLASVRVSDKVVAKGSRVGGRLVVTKLQVEGRTAPAAPPAPVDDSAPTTVPVSTPPPTIVI